MQLEAMHLETDAVGEDGTIDARYTCDSDNSSPELRWSYIPKGTSGFALIAEDPDAPQGIFTHWLIYNIPSNIHHLPAGIPAQEALPNGIMQGTNSFGKLGYSGPCPPMGDRPHRYVFRLYALKPMERFGKRLVREELLRGIHSFILATAEITGIYKRSIQRAG